MPHEKKTTQPTRESRILRERRMELCLTQMDIARECGIELQQYQRYEYGESAIANSRMKIGLRICAVLELDPYEVVFGYDR